MLFALMLELLLLLVVGSHCVGSQKINPSTVTEWVEEAVANETALLRMKVELLFELSLSELKLQVIKANALEREAQYECTMKQKEAELERLRAEYIFKKEEKLRILKEKLEELKVL
jgi:hypothetical protein